MSQRDTDVRGSQAAERSPAGLPRPRARSARCAYWPGATSRRGGRGGGGGTSGRKAEGGGRGGKAAPPERWGSPASDPSCGRGKGGMAGETGAVGTPGAAGGG